jgi:hypothetical protein
MPLFLAWWFQLNLCVYAVLAYRLVTLHILYGLSELRTATCMIR